MWYNEYLKDAVNPNWEEFDKGFHRVHNWRTYITEEVRAHWNNISVIGRCAVISCCEAMADREEWD